MPRGPQYLLAVLDGALLLVSFALAHWLRFGSGLIAAPLGVIPLADWLLLGLASLPLWLLIFALHGLYYTRIKQALSAEIGALTHSVAEGLLATILLTFALRNLPDSRLALVFMVVIAWLLLAAGRAIARRLADRHARAVVIGTSPTALHLARAFASGRRRFVLAAQHPSPELVDFGGIDSVFCDADQAEVLWKSLGRGPGMLAVHLIPQDSATGGGALAVATVEGVPTLSVKSERDLAVMRKVKRTMDITFAGLLMLLTAPLWIIVILGIVTTMPGPVFFSHERLGLRGRKFRALKFRSMVRDAANIKVDLAGFDDKYKLTNDPRVTPFGRLLRKTSLDELPQLINILRGELSLVGPRAIVEPELEKYGPWGNLLLTVPPGLTGLWQVSGRSDTTYQERIDYDLYYINNWSPGLDLLIILRTIPAVLSRKGAY